MTGLQRIELSRSRVVELLTELGEDLASQGVKGRLFVVGGAAMALAFNTARTTADVDAVFEPKSKVYDAARRLADRHGDLSADWLNDAVKGYPKAPMPERSSSSIYPVWRSASRPPSSCWP